MKKEHRVFGPPGTGKTWYLKEQINLATKKHGSRKILVTSFTRAAAQEIVSRNSDISSDQVGTLHKFGCKALKIQPKSQLAEKHVKEWNDYCKLPSFQLTGEAVKDFDNPLDSALAGAKGDQLLSEYSLYRNMLIDRDKIQKPSVRGFAEKWENFKTEFGFYDFTDMIDLAEKECEYPPNRESVIFVDEAQDLTPLQHRLVKKWGNTADKFILVGDDDQTIYEWAGATANSLLEPELDEDQTTVLSRSYRVPRAIHRLSVKWINQIHTRKKKEYEPTEIDGVVRHLPNKYKDPGNMIRKISKEIDDKTVMILASTKYMLYPIIKLLKSEGIPFGNQFRKTAYDWNPLYREHGISNAERLINFTKTQNNDVDDYLFERPLWTYKELNTWANKLKADVFKERGIKSEISKMSKTKLAETTLGVGYVKHFFKKEHWESILKADARWFLRNTQNEQIRQGFNFPVNVLLKQKSVDKLLEIPKITVGTIHSVKGGEADCVYLFPDLSPEGYHKWKNQSTRDSIIRLFYVGMTRARHELSIMTPCTNLSIKGVF